MKEHLLNSYKNRRQEIRHYARYVFKKPFISREELDTFVDLVYGLISENTDEMYRMLADKKPVVMPTNRQLYPNLYLDETDISDELADDQPPAPKQVAQPPKKQGKVQAQIPPPPPPPEPEADDDEPEVSPATDGEEKSTPTIYLEADDETSEEDDEDNVNSLTEEEGER